MYICLVRYSSKSCNKFNNFVTIKEIKEFAFKDFNERNKGFILQGGNHGY